MIAAMVFAIPAGLMIAAVVFAIPAMPMISCLSEAQVLASRCFESSVGSDAGAMDRLMFG
jgi:hypothetical protein